MKPRIGDHVIVPWRTHRRGTQVIGGWHEGHVVATRGRDRVIVTSYGYEHEYPVYEVQPYPLHWRDWPRAAPGYL